MRTLNEHKINPGNDTLTITVLDEPGHGGANHAYDITGGVNQVYTNIEPGDPTQEGMLLRDYFAAQVVSAVFHGVFEDWRQNKAGIQEDWPTGIAVDAYRVADAMLKIREAT